MDNYLEYLHICQRVRGNCALVWHKNTYILIDAGISMRRIVNNLKSWDLRQDRLHQY